MSPELIQLAPTIGVVGTLIIGFGTVMFMWMRSRISIRYKRDMQKMKLDHEREMQQLRLQEQRATHDLAEEAVDVETLHTLNIAAVNQQERINRLQDEKDEEKRRADANWNDLQEARAEIAKQRLNTSKGGEADVGNLPTNYDEMIRLQEDNAQLRLELDTERAKNLVLISDLQRVNDYIARLGGHHSSDDILPEFRQED